MTLYFLPSSTFSCLTSQYSASIHRVNKMRKSSSITCANVILVKQHSTVSRTYQENLIHKCKPYSAIPGPKPIPILGNTWRFIPFIGDYKIQSIDKLTVRLYKQYGSIVKLNGLLGRPDMVFLYDADEIEKVFRNEELMPHRPSMPSLNYYKHVLRRDFFGEEPGVIAVHGEGWYKFRTKIQQPMLQPRTAKLYSKIIEETADLFIDRCKSIRNKKLEMPEDFLNEIHKWSLESIGRVALDARLGCFDNDNAESQQLINAVVTFFKNVPILELKIPFWKFFPTPTWKEYIKSLDTIKDITSTHIAAALKELEKRNIKEVNNESSLLQRILAIDNSPKTATILALDMFLVGIDTTSTAVASILYQLSKHPEKQDKLFKEVERILPNKNSKLTHNALEEMTYLRAVIKETLRMYPVVIGNGRTMMRDTIVSGYEIPKGVQIVFQHYVISNLEKYFPQPNHFIPERWLKEDNKSSIHPFASLPFGYGRRMCLGRRFADLEIQSVIAKVVRSFIIEYHYGDLDYYIHPMYTPNGPLKFRFIDRIQ